MPMPARRIGQTATFLPEMRGTVVRSSGVETSTSSVARSFVASYVSRSVSSLTSRRKSAVDVDCVAEQAELVEREGMADFGDGHAT